MNGDSLSDAEVISAPRRQRERQQRRADILRAAEQVFAAKGFHTASIEEIARAAEFATGTVYLYFKDKETLYIELFEQKIRELNAAVRAEAEAIKDPLDALRALVNARMGYFERNRGFFRIYAREGMNRFEKRHDRWEGVMSLYQEYLALIAKLIQSGQKRGQLRKGDPHLFAVALSGMMIQLTRDWLQSQEETPLTARADFVVELFLAGARAK
jgi:TetR/AcrR family transcriptional regulator, fatty acid metabolism regulator protein